MAEIDIVPKDGQDFKREGMIQLNNLVLGEEDAKLAVLASMVMGEKVLLSGPPGGGKTSLGRDSLLIVDGIDPANMAAIPMQSDLLPQRLIGGTAEITKEVDYGEGAEGSFTETSSTVIKPIISPSTQVIFANEINRINPAALNAILDGLEKGVIDTTAGPVALDSLEFVISTMNPSDSRNGTFHISNAMASRHGLGVVMGEEQSVNDKQIGEIMSGPWVPSPDKIEPVVTLDQLRALRGRVNTISISEAFLPHAVKLARNTQRQLREEARIVEAPGRIASQLARTSRTLALLGGEVSVNEEHLSRAVKFIVTARLGALSTKASQDVANIHNAIVS